MDALVVWFYSTVASMPGLLFILAIAVIVGKGLLGVYLGIGLTTWGRVCVVLSVVRSLSIKHGAYIDAARVLGYSDFRILFRHILPNVSHLILIIFSIRFPSAIATEIYVGFLGIGVQNEPSWGVMINNARLRLWQGVLVGTHLCHHCYIPDYLGIQCPGRYPARRFRSAAEDGRRRVLVVKKYISIHLISYTSAPGDGLLQSQFTGRSRSLMYHNVGDEKQDFWTVPTDVFKQQIAWLQESGYTTILPEDIYAYSSEERTLPEKPVLLTF